MSIEAMKLVVMPEPPPEFQTEAEKTAYAFGWWKALESVRAEKQEPVAWATQLGEYAHIQWGSKRPEYPMVYDFPLYTSPPPRQPVAWMDSNDDVFFTEEDAHKTGVAPIKPLYTAPPPRQWVGLTDEEIDNINYTSAHMLAREVEAKLKQKNGYNKENT